MEEEKNGIARDVARAMARGVPIVALRAADQTSAAREVAAADIPAIRWDIMRGFSPLNEGGIAALASSGIDPGTTNPGDALIAAERLPGGTACVIAQASRYWTAPDVVQGIANLRDVYKQDGRCLILLAPPGTDVPVEIEQDCLPLDLPLPDDAALAEIVRAVHEDAGLPVPDDLVVASAVDATRGLSAFAAEQVLALSLQREGIDTDALWRRKAAMIEQAAGLSVWRGGETFSQLGGLQAIKLFCERILAGRRPPRAVVFIDEIEKALAGSGGRSGLDTSGVSQGVLQALLTHMQDRAATGLILIGPPGTGKSAIAKAMGREGGIPTIAMDLGRMKGSLVGQTEGAVRRALAVIDAVAGSGGALYVATCNAISILPPELRRRFTLGTWFVDLPSADERAAIWDIYRQRYELPGDDPVPPSRGWTGAEIRACAEIAWRLRIPLAEAAQYVVPVSVAAAELIATLRAEASGRYLDASRPGVYRPRDDERQDGGRAPARRKLEV